MSQIQILVAIGIGILVTLLSLKLDSSSRQRDSARMLALLRQIENHLAAMRRFSD